MVTAEQASRGTLKSLKVTAEKFVETDIDPAILKAMEDGKFSLKVHLGDFTKYLDNFTTKMVAKIICKILEERRFTAEHIYYDNTNGYANYILVEWKRESEANAI